MPATPSSHRHICGRQGGSWNLAPPHPGPPSSLTFPGRCTPAWPSGCPRWGGRGQRLGQVCNPLTEDSGKGFLQLLQTRESGFHVREHTFHHFYLLRQDSELGLLHGPRGGSVHSNWSQAPSPPLARPSGPRKPWPHLQVGPLRRGSRAAWPVPRGPQGEPVTLLHQPSDWNQLQRAANSRANTLSLPVPLEDRPQRGPHPVLPGEEPVAQAPATEGPTQRLPLA